MDLELYTKPVDELILKHQLSVSCFGGQCQCWKTSSVTGVGETPRDAIQDYFKKLNKRY